MRPAILVVTAAFSVPAAALCAQTPKYSTPQPIVPDSTARAHVGQVVTVEGTVVSIDVSDGPRKLSRVSLDFGAPRPNQTFSALIVGPVLRWFPNLREWKGKRVRVTGLVRLEEGRPTMLLNSPSQLRGARWYVFPAPGAGD